MYCKHCGQYVDDNARFCTHCGAEQDPPKEPRFCRSCGAEQGPDTSETDGFNTVPPQYNTVPPQYNTAPSQSQDTEKNYARFHASPDRSKAAAARSGSNGFTEAIRLFFTQYATFSGRSTRSEFWWTWLFCALVGVGLTVITGAVDSLSWLSSIWSLAIMIPCLALSVRRLHDVGKSGAFYLWFLLPLAGPIILLIQFCKDSEGNNQYGPSPKGY